MKRLAFTRAVFLLVAALCSSTGARAAKEHESRPGTTREEAINLLHQHSKPGTVGKVMGDTAGGFLGMLKFCGAGEAFWSPKINAHYELLAKTGELDKSATKHNLELRAQEETNVWKQTDSKLGKHTPSCTRASILKVSALKTGDSSGNMFMEEVIKDIKADK